MKEPQKALHVKETKKTGADAKNIHTGFTK